MDMLMIMYAMPCWNAISDTHQKWPTLPSWRLLYWQYGMICHMSSLIRRSYHFTTVCNRFWSCCCNWWTFRIPSLSTEWRT